MDNDDTELAIPPPLKMLMEEDLDSLSISEIRERITTLEGEIDRSRSAISAKERSRDAAENVFRT